MDKLKLEKFFMGNPSQNHGCHRSMVLTILLAARHSEHTPTLTQPVKAGTRFTYPGGMEG